MYSYNKIWILYNSLILRFTMASIEEVNEMWKSDSVIDRGELDHEALRSPILHQKYFELYVKHKERLIKMNRDMGVLRRDKHRYYRGEMSKEELENRGWSQWLYAKVLKTDMEDVLNGDDDICNLKVKIEYFELVVEALSSILSQIKERRWDIKNAIEYLKFKNGV